MKTSLIISVMCVGIVISLVLAIGCNNKKCTAPIESSKFLMKDYFPLNEGDKWSWKVPGWIAKNEYVDGDSTLGEPYLDLNQNGVRDVNEIFQDLNGNELFSLVCPGPGELPYLLEEGKSSYFKLIWKTAHLYQVEDDYTLTLVDLSPEALQCGVKAPERVTPDAALFKKLQAALTTLPA